MNHPERAVIGACLVDPDAMHTALDLVAPADFASPGLAEIWAAMCELAADGEPTDVVTVADRFSDRNLADLSEMAQFAPATRNVATWADLVKKNSRAGKVRVALNNALSNLDREGTDAVLTALAAQTEAVVGDAGLMDMRAAAGELSRQMDISQELIAKYGCPGIPTGHTPLQIALGGLRPEFIILAARPSIGKTSAAWTMAERIAGIGEPVGYFTAEMKAYELICRSYAKALRRPYRQIVEGSRDVRDRIRHLPEAKSIHQLPIMIDEASTSLNQILARMHQMARKGAKAIIYDHAGHITHNGLEGVALASAIGKAFKATQKKLEIPIIALLQLNRGSEVQNRRPGMHDLRGSGTWEEDAGIIVILHSDDPEASVRDVEWIFPKNRNNARDKDLVSKFDGRYQEWK